MEFVGKYHKTMRPKSEKEWKKPKVLLPGKTKDLELSKKQRKELDGERVKVQSDFVIEQVITLISYIHKRTLQMYRWLPDAIIGLLIFATEHV
ncbi:MAG: hypothetical protein EZS28_052937, partial [Streblomastix strix]